MWSTKQTINSHGSQKESEIVTSDVGWYTCTGSVRYTCTGSVRYTCTGSVRYTCTGSVRYTCTGSARSHIYYF
jgi:hypothetical protein